MKLAPPTETIEISERRIGGAERCFIVAEAGVNHNGDVDLAHALVDAAAEAGADAVKFQTFCAERLVSRTAPKAAYQLARTNVDESQFDMLKRVELPASAHRELFDHCRQKGLTFLSTPFDEDAADFLEKLGVAAYKIPSGELTNLPLLAHVARKRRPMIVSTGMASLAEVAAAVDVIEQAGGHRQVALLHCVTNYPADPRDCNLRAMQTLRTAFGLPVGWSDHSVGVCVAIAAVTLGACLVEKHLTMDSTLPGPDHATSLTPDELRLLVEGIRQVESALGDAVKRPAAAELQNISIARKSMHWRRGLSRGAAIEAGDLIALRPGQGISPAAGLSLIKRKLAREVQAGAMVTEEDLEP